MVEPMAAIEAREDQLVAALDQWNEARRLARERSGETAAEERSEQLYNESYDARARIASTRARTLSGMLAKLAFIASGFGVGACGRNGNVRANAVQRRGGLQGARVHGLNAYRDAAGCGHRGNSAAGSRHTRASPAITASRNSATVFSMSSTLTSLVSIDSCLFAS
jgi:hypothetical protein